MSASAEAALNKSLDDLIAEQRTKSAAQKQKKETRKGKRAGGDEPMKGPRRQSGGASRAPHVLSITVKGGGVGKRQQQRGGPAPRLREEREQNPAAREAALEGNAKWGHDAYRGPVAARGGAGPRGRADPRDPDPRGTKLYISNLHYSVTDADVKELFETCGKLVKHCVHYDSSDRSLGTAEVVFQLAADAERAMRNYNAVQLDGQPMQIEVIAQGAPAAAGGPRTLSSGIRISGERGGARGGGPRVVQLTRHFQQAAGGSEPRSVRGRGSVRSARGGVAAMQE